MPRLKKLSGKEVVKILLSFGFEVAGQRGSHIKLKRLISEAQQTLTIPMHDELDVGTLHAIYRQVSRYISPEDLRHHFHTD